MFISINSNMTLFRTDYKKALPVLVGSYMLDGL